MEDGKQTMPQDPQRSYRISVRPSPKNPSHYIWTITGTACLYREVSPVEYKSVEQALADASFRLAELD